MDSGGTSFLAMMMERNEVKKETGLGGLVEERGLWPSDGGRPEEFLRMHFGKVKTFLHKQVCKKSFKNLKTPTI